MSAVALITFVRLAAGQITIDSDKIPFFFSKSRKLFLSGYKVDKTAPRLRRG
jgi:hypothetical protein